MEKVLKLLENSCSPHGGWGIGWQRERKVGPRRHSGKGNHITLAQNLHDPSIHSPSLPRWPKLGQAAAYSLRGTRLLLPKTPPATLGVGRLLEYLGVLLVVRRRRTLRRSRRRRGLRLGLKPRGPRSFLRAYGRDGRLRLKVRLVYYTSRAA